MATLSPRKRTSTDSAGLPDSRGLRNKKHCVGEEEEKKTCEVFVVNKGSSNGHIFSIARSGLHKIVLEGKTLTCELQDVDSVTPRLWVTVYPSQPDVALLDPKVVEAERKEYTRVLNELTIALDNAVAALLKALREVAVNNVTNAEITGLNCEVALLSQKLGAHKDLQTLPCSVIKSERKYECKRGVQYHLLDDNLYVIFYKTVSRHPTSTDETVIPFAIPVSEGPPVRL